MGTNKTIKIIQLALLVVLVIVLSFVMLRGDFRGSVGHSFSGIVEYGGTLVEAKTESINAKTMKELVIDVNIADVIISKSGNEDLIVTEWTNDKEKKELFTLNHQQEKVSITRPHKNYFGMTPKHKVEVKVPEHFEGNMVICTSSGSINIESSFKLENFTTQQSSGDLNVEAFIEAKVMQCSVSSGSIVMDQVKTETYNISSSSGSSQIKHLEGAGVIGASSGDIEIDLLSGENHILNASSGSIDIEKITGNAQVQTSSGEISVDALNSESILVKTSSGHIEIDSLAAAGMISTTSGGIEVGSLVPMGSLKLESSSGSIEVELAEESNCTLRADVSSGNIGGDVNWNYEDKHKKQATAKVGSGNGAEIQISTTSGSIYVD